MSSRWAAGRFGGDVQGLSSPQESQDMVCLHRLTSPAAARVSVAVLRSTLNPNP